MRTAFRNLVTAGLALVLALSATVITFAQDTDAQPFLGITFTDDDSAAVVRGVISGGPADEAGLATGDVILAVDGEEVTADTLADTISAFAVGDSVTLTVERGDETLELSVMLAERPEEPTRDRPRLRLQQPGFLGVTLEETDDGLIIADIASGSAAEEAGLAVDDVLAAINGEAVETVQDAAAIMAELEVGDAVTLDIVRAGEALTVDATLGSRLDALRQGGVLRGGLSAGISYNGDEQSWEINSLSEDSALFEAGLREGDVITAFDGEPRDPAGLLALLAGQDDEALITLTIERDGESVDIEAPVEALAGFGRFGFHLRGRVLPFGRDFDGLEGFAAPFNRGSLGVRFVTLDEAEAEARGLDVSEGALITEVLEDTPAAEAGLQVDDIITAVDGDVVDEQRTLAERLFAYEGGDSVTLSVLRGGEDVEVAVTLTEGGPGLRALPGLPFDFEDLPFDLPEGFGLHRDGGRFFFFGPDGGGFQFHGGGHGGGFFAPGRPDAQPEAEVEPDV